VTPDDLDSYLRDLGLTVEIINDSEGKPHTVVRQFTIPSGSLTGRICDVAIMRPPGVPYTVPAAIHTRPALVAMGTLSTQASPLGPDWQYWSRRFDHPPTPQLIWTHILTVLSEP